MRLKKNVRLKRNGRPYRVLPAGRHRKKTVKNSTTSPAVIKRDIAIAQALNLRLAGKPFRVIAAELDIAISTAAEWVQEGLARIVNEPAMAHLKMDLARLDAMMVAAYPLATNAKNKKWVDAVRAMLMIIERRARLLGLGRDGARTLNLTAMGGNNKIELVFVPGPGEIEDKSVPH